MPKEIPEPNLISTVIIGAGPAGLATAACLKKARMPFIILEKESRVGASWNKHYDRLHLNTDKYSSSLPYLPFPSSCPKYPARKDVISYLETYASHFGLTPHLSEPVLNARRYENLWLIRTPADTYRTKNLVVASGNNQNAVIPHWEREKDFQGKIQHSRDYRNGKPFKGQKVLVVGIGNSGGEIARDLCQHGAHVAICVRGRVNSLPRDIFGISILKTMTRLSQLPLAFSDYLRSLLFDLFCYHLPRQGLIRPAYDPITQANRLNKLPLLDNGTIALIKKGRIKIHPAIMRFGSEEIHFEDGNVERFDAVILATGYRPRLDSFLELDADILDDDGRPRLRSCISSLPGLYFCGFTIYPGGVLNTIGKEALRICRHIIDMQKR